MDNNLEIVQTRDEADSRNGRVMPLYTTKGGEMGRSESISDIDLHIVADFQGAVGGIDETVTRGMFKENGDGLHKTSQSSTVLLNTCSTNMYFNCICFLLLAYRIVCFYN